MHICCRSPRGERGLKFLPFYNFIFILWSLPSRGAWIEIFCLEHDHGWAGSLPSRGAWIEILPSLPHRPCGACRSPRGERGLKLMGRAGRRDLAASLPSRGAWIEIIVGIVKGPIDKVVAPLAGSVD